MTFDLRAIVVFGAAGLVYAGLLPEKWRAWTLMVASLVAIYWLQPPLPIRFSDYILPTATIGLTVISWWFTRSPGDPVQVGFLRQDRLTLGVTAAVGVALSFMRFVGAEFRITASRPPSPLMVILVLAVLGLVAWAAMRLTRGQIERNQRRILTALILLVVLLFVLLKTGSLSAWAARWWRSLTGQDTSLASPIDLAWLGFSFVAFRLIHTLRDRQTGILPPLSLREYLTYVIFFASYTAGPIDRAERFSGDFQALPELRGLDPARLGQGGWRIAVGLLKKFVIADTLAQGLNLTATNAVQADSAAGLWILLYGYALRLYFDFAGYTDIAIGIGLLYGIKLPENFDRPYLKSNITAFWQSWHITLSTWVRFYVFSPLSRWLLTRKWRPSSTVIVLMAQVATMVVIGLWHGITWNFFIWGLWHGLGLFVHKQWSDRTRKWYQRLGERPWRRRAWTFFAWFLTFNFVILGWVWFALPTIQLSIDVFLGLFGIGS